MGKRRKKNVAEKFVCIGVFLLVVITVSMVLTLQVKSRSRNAVLFDNRRYEASEEAYKAQVKGILSDYGMSNSGLTMTRTVSMDGEREYRIDIYDRKLAKLEDHVMDSLTEELGMCKVILNDSACYPVEISYVKIN